MSVFVEKNIMKNSLTNIIKEFIKVIIIVAIAIPVINIMAAVWTGPTTAPPGGNAAAPINAGPLDQIKSGGWLSLGNLISRGTTLLARDSGNVGIGLGVTATGDPVLPSEKLDVAGGIKIGDTAGTNAGTIKYTGSDFLGRVGVGAGGAWKSLTGSGSGGGLNYVGSCNAYSISGGVGMCQCGFGTKIMLLEAQTSYQYGTTMPGKCSVIGQNTPSVKGQVESNPFGPSECAFACFK